MRPNLTFLTDRRRRAHRDVDRSRDGSVARRPSLGQRLGVEPYDGPAGAPERAVGMARAAFYLYAAGGTLALVSLALPGSAGSNERVIVGAALAAYAFAGLFLAAFDQTPLWAFQLGTACGTVLVTVASYFGGEIAAVYPLLYLWVIVYALYFFPRRRAALHIGFVVVAFALVLPLLRWEGMTPAAASVGAGTICAVGVMALLVKARIERLLESVDATNRALRTSEARLRRQNAHLRDLDRIKDELVSVVSHELRTPLTSIRGYVEYLLADDGESLTEEQQECLSIVNRNANRLLRVVTDLLFLAQADAGKLVLDRERVDVGNVLAESVAAAKPLAAEKQISLGLQSAAMPTIVGDRARLAQLVDNLIGNAIKFTLPGGRVEVAARALDGSVLVDVSDTGIGVPAADHALVFERFFRTKKADEEAIQGTGLGLSIVKAIAEGHGGTVELESREGSGSRFTVTLPLAAAADAAPLDAPAAAVESPPNG